MSDSLYIIIPAYNEEMNIETIAGNGIRLQQPPVLIPAWLS